MAVEPRKFVLIPVNEFTLGMLDFTIQKDVSQLRVCRFPNDPVTYYLLKWRQGNPQIFKDYDKKNLNQITQILANELNSANTNLGM